MESRATLADFITDIAERSGGPARQERLEEARRAYEAVASAASHAELTARSTAGLARVQAVQSAAST